MAKIRSCKIAVMLLVTAFMCSCSSSGRISEKSGFVFDTYFNVVLEGTGTEESMQSLTEVFFSLDEAFSLCYTTNAGLLPESHVYAECLDKCRLMTEKYGRGINVMCGRLTALWGISTDTPDVPEKSEISEALAEITDYGNINEDSMFDFGAVAKGYACDKAYSLLKRTDTKYGAVSLGSSTLLFGRKPDGRKFRAGITNPDMAEGYLGIIETDAAFISTSGGYERYFEAEGRRYSHILDMETGYPAETDLTSVTVIIPSETEDGGIMSDFLSTLIYIEGSRQLDKWLAYEEFELVAADTEGRVYTDCGGFILDESSGYSYGKQE